MPDNHLELKKTDMTHPTRKSHELTNRIHEKAIRLARAYTTDTTASAYSEKHIMKDSKITLDPRTKWPRLKTACEVKANTIGKRDVAL